MQLAVTATDLRKVYRQPTGESVVGLDDIDLEVRTGEIFGLIGADGAGKTTLFQILAGVLEPTSGSVEILGQSPSQAQGRVGFLTQPFSLHQDLSIDENLHYLAGLRDVSPQDFRARSERYLSEFGLAQFRTRLAGRLSGGMKQKLALTGALISDPEIILLDEPTVGVDPLSRREFWDVLWALARGGKTIVVATPYFDEAARCSRVALVESGRVLRVDEPRALAAEYGAGSLEDAFVALLEHERGHEEPPPFPEPSAKRDEPGKPALSVHQLEKRFGDFRAVKGIDLVFRHGETYGLLGANGAGKTTAIKMMCGLSAPTSGTVWLMGRQEGLTSPAVRSQMGYKSQKFALYDDLTVGENLDFYAGLYGVPARLRAKRKQWALEAAGLAARENALTAMLPDGWKQRVAFGAAMMHEPRVVLLDEPSSGVDALARRSMWKLIRSFADHGMAVLVVTHYLDEAERCTRLGFMAEGELRIEGTPAEVKSSAPGGMLEVKSDRLELAAQALRSRFGAECVSHFGDRLHVHCSGVTPEALCAELRAQGRRQASAEPVDPSLEDAVLALLRHVSQK